MMAAGNGMRDQSEEALNRVDEEGPDPIWTKVFDDKGCNEGILAIWRRKYLFPFGDIAPLYDSEVKAADAFNNELEDME